MPKLPRLTGKEMVRFLERYGLRVVRIVGSHHFLDGGGKRTTVPVHGNRSLKIGTLRAILRDIDLAPDEFQRLWHKWIAAGSGGAPLVLGFAQVCSR